MKRMVQRGCGWAYYKKPDNFAISNRFLGTHDCAGYDDGWRCARIEEL